MSAQTELRFPAGSQPVETSEDAADALSPDELNRRRQRVLELFADAGERGLTADEVVARLGTGRRGDHNTWAPRVTELFRKYWLLDRLDGKEGRRKEKRPTGQGGMGFVHVINQRGLRYLGR